MRQYGNLIFIKDFKEGDVDISDKDYLSYFIVRHQHGSNFLYYIPYVMSPVSKDKFKKEYDFTRQLNRILR